MSTSQIHRHFCFAGSSSIPPRTCSSGRAVSYTASRITWDLPGSGIKKPGHNPGLNWRIERDSNPRYALGVHTISNRAPSTTRPSIRKQR